MTLRHRIATAYERSAWARLVILLVIIGVHLAGQGVVLHLDAPEWVQMVLSTAWLFVWCTGAVIYLKPRREQCITIVNRTSTPISEEECRGWIGTGPR